MSFYIRGFINTSSYSCPTNWWPGCIYDLSLYDTLYIIDLQCTFSVGVMVSSLIQISTRLAKINKPIGADKGLHCWAWNGFVYSYFAFANFALIFFMIYLLTFNCQTSNIITFSKLKTSWPVAHRKATADKSSIIQKLSRVYFVNWTQINYNDDFRLHTYNMFALFTNIKRVLFITDGYLLFLPRIYMYDQCYHN